MRVCLPCKYTFIDVAVKNKIIFLCALFCSIPTLYERIAKAMGIFHFVLEMYKNGL